ncbi:toprim domain-containing protein [Metabacillus rhizolycopersici]|uniref:DUF2399 domain-containing protein n=1 Tax=Metabacillus rhizolycopersici TaxID=2875709 RepID=A0ABS7UTR4_9BACI|nr:toprim domain-containing protein [Metabacillus rhizolycopersici]MBZ5751700.1 DUF2399 domain-containing protein [Metabacillus rhizolycopersici]
MIEESLYTYIQQFILKSGEELEWNQPTNEDILIEGKIIKRSERTYRVLGLLSLSIQMPKADEMLIDQKLEALVFTTRKKVNLDDRDRQTFRWLEEGWIIKEVRFEKDEKTVRTSHYRMGFRLYQYEQVKLQQKLEQTHNEFFNIKNDLLAMCESKSDKQQRDLGIQNIIKIINQLNPNELSTSLYFSKTWPLRKRLKYLHFVRAFCQLSFQKEEFDWKEIGAAYFQKIGGSKEFDSYKQEFLDHLEEWANVPVDELGLTSLGQITPVFFAGQLSGKYAAYHWGAVHALTHLAIATEAYETKATTLWLVENRAILTRMSAAEHFLKETNSLMICIDGHLRSAHKKAISQILSNSKVEQVIIWCDYDLDGLHISKEIHRVVNQYNELTLKWVLPDQQVTGDSNQYEQYVTSFLQHNKMEQERILGGEEQWKSWILA